MSRTERGIRCQRRNRTCASGEQGDFRGTDSFPTESNYMGSRQQFVQSSSTFKDPERASLRDSGHGDSDQADSDQDTNKGSCCDMSAKEALKMKATGVKPPPLEQACLGKPMNVRPDGYCQASGFV
ncbi:unnamed protein product [Boreogadus saida]